MTRKTLRKLTFAVAIAMTGAIAYAADPPKPVAPPGSPVEPALPRALRAKQILGTQISIQNNTAIGTVDDIVLSDAGEVEYLIVQTSDKKLVTIPWSAAVWGADQKSAVVNITPEQYKGIPTYTTMAYPEYFTPTYRTEVYKYYGLTPGQLRRLNRRLP